MTNDGVPPEAELTVSITKDNDDSWDWTLMQGDVELACATDYLPTCEAAVAAFLATFTQLTRYSSWTEYPADEIDGSIILRPGS